MIPIDMTKSNSVREGIWDKHHVICTINQTVNFIGLCLYSRSLIFVRISSNGYLIIQDVDVFVRILLDHFCIKKTTLIGTSLCAKNTQISFGQHFRSPWRYIVSSSYWNSHRELWTTYCGFLPLLLRITNYELKKIKPFPNNSW